MNTHVKLLTRAKEVVDSGEALGICGALDWAVAEQVVGAFEHAELIRRIQQGLGGHGWLGCWLAEELGYTPELPIRDLCRMAWIDKLIEEYACAD